MTEMGHNRPPLVEAARLRDDYADLWLESHGIREFGEELAFSGINCEDEAQKAADALKMATRQVQKVDEARKVEKEPYLEAGRVVDGFFKSMAVEAEKGKATIQKVLKGWLDRKAAEAKAAAERLAEPAEAPKVQSDYGTTVSYRSIWKFDVVTKADVPLEYLTVSDALVTAAIRAGVREIPGIHIYEEKKAVAR